MLISLGKAVNKAREERGESLQVVAKASKISASYLQKLERGVVNSPSPRVLRRLSAAVGVTYFRLMELAGYLDEAQLAEAEKRTPAPQPYPLAKQGLTKEEWRAVQAFIKVLKAQRDPDPAG